MHAQLSIFDPITFVCFCIKWVNSTSIRDIYIYIYISSKCINNWIWRTYLCYTFSEATLFCPVSTTMMNLHLANTIIDLINGKFMLFTFISLFFYESTVRWEFANTAYIWLWICPDAIIRQSSNIKYLLKLYANIRTYEMVFLVTDQLTPKCAFVFIIHFRYFDDARMKRTLWLQ